MTTIHYIFHMAMCFVAGLAAMLVAWANSLNLQSLYSDQAGEAAYHSKVRRWALVLFLVCIALAAVVPARAQAPDGRMYHQLPPPMNVVNAGILTERSADARQSATLALLAGTLTYFILEPHNRTAAISTGTIGVGFSVVFNLRSARHERIAGQLLMCGFSAQERYDLVPDSVDNHRRSRILPR